VNEAGRLAPGVQKERTALAWQRTALSLMVAAVVTARLTYERLGPAAVVVTGVGLAASGWVFWTSRSRYRHHARLHAARGERGGRSGLALAATVVLLAATELASLPDAR
jgi:uncharacterized membrane protein YidH (DUF202 family)